MFTTSRYIRLALWRLTASLLVCSFCLSACGTASNTDGPVRQSVDSGGSSTTAGNTAIGAGEKQVEDTAGLKKRLIDERGILYAAPRASISIYTEQAKAGDSDAQTRLAVCYYVGQGTEENKGEAKKWFTSASEANDKKAQYCLAYMIEHGEGGSADKREAFLWYQIAAEGTGKYPSLADIEVVRLSSDFDQIEKDRIKKEVLDWFNLSKHRKTKAEKTRRSY